MGQILILSCGLRDKLKYEASGMVDLSSLRFMSGQIELKTVRNTLKAPFLLMDIVVAGKQYWPNLVSYLWGTVQIEM